MCSKSTRYITGLLSCVKIDVSWVGDNLHIVGALLCADESHQSRMFLRFYKPWVIIVSSEECFDGHSYVTVRRHHTAPV
jgi:hypothetical protein